jgi:hypothetical protein
MMMLWKVLFVISATETMAVTEEEEGRAIKISVF